jgi:hypothetical protein
MRSPDHYYQEHGVANWGSAEQAIGSLAVEINLAALQAVEQIADIVTETYPTRNPILQRSLESYMPEEVPHGEFWISSRPAEVFSSEPVFTVTSTLALETPQTLLDEDTLLIIPIDQKGEEVATHRGIGLPLFSEFMYQLTGSTMGRKDDCVWLGAQVDMEQVMLEDRIAQKGPQLDEEIREIFLALIP